MTSERTDANADVQRLCRLAGLPRATYYRHLNRHSREAAGLDETIFSGHSMRAGFVTSALADGQDPLKVSKISRHRKIDTLKIYDRRETEFDDHAGDGFS
ncbi:hypothetical protein [Bradyrhizobium liaoningense]